MTRRSITETLAISTTSIPKTGEVKASFDGRLVTYGFGELDTLVPAYAATIHKSQGSEIPRRDHPCPHPALRNAAAKPSSTPASPAASGPWSLSARRMPSRSRFATCIGPATLVEARRMAWAPSAPSASSNSSKAVRIHRRWISRRNTNRRRPAALSRCQLSLRIEYVKEHHFFVRHIAYLFARRPNGVSE